MLSYDKSFLDVTHDAEKAFEMGNAKRALGIVVSGELRRVIPDVENPIYSFLRAHQELLASYFIYSTAGTYRDLFWDKVTTGTKNWSSGSPFEGFCLRGGKEGGMIQLAALVERRKHRLGAIVTEVDGPVQTLLLLLHPKDHEEIYPEDQALLRAAIRNNILLLTTLESAAEWAQWEAVRGTEVSRLDNRGREVLALIAHDRRKLEICKWAVRYRERLSLFEEIVTTGTTGRHVYEFLEAAGVKAEIIKPRFSGPEGGDIQIADLILREKCQHVVFFVDPTTAHPHESDIRALVRICSLPTVKVNLRLNERSATSWIKSYPC